jgi:hypothetical protein
VRNLAKAQRSRGPMPVGERTSGGRATGL